MFGKRKELPGAIDLSGLGFLADATEFARLWNEPGGSLTAIIDPRGLGADPALFGLALVDAARHAAKAYAQAVNIPEDEAMARIWEGFDAERSSPADTPKQIDPETGKIS